MSENDEKVMGWGTIIAIMVGVGLAVGMTLGLLSGALGFSSNRLGAGVGASMGVVGALLIARRAKALANKPKPGT
jgi:hypothetical protein